MHIANTWRIDAMNFYKTLDLIMRQDIGGRGLLPSLPASPLAETAAALSGAKRAVLLTGFPMEALWANRTARPDRQPQPRL